MTDLPKLCFVFQTDYEGQAKKLLELMESTDVIIVAGGDGTLQEVGSSPSMDIFKGRNMELRF